MDIQCARCAEPLTCQPEGECWCMALPFAPIPEGAAAEGCLCPDCLKQDLARRALEATLPERPGH